MSSVHYINVIDRSGSMSGRIHDVVPGYNLLNRNSLADGQKARVTLCSFDDQFEILYEKVKLKKVKELTIEDVMPRGGTALYDAVAKAMALGNPDKPTIVQIFSDGGENCSREVVLSALKTLIENREKGGWEIQFIGMDIDAQKAASGIELQSRGSTLSQTQNFVTTNVGLYGEAGPRGAMGVEGDVGMKRARYAKAIKKKAEEKDKTVESGE